jgi:hypothetical protein
MKMADYNTEPRLWEIKLWSNHRFVIIDPTSGKVLHDQSGYGFKSYEKAYNYGYNQYHTNPVGYIESNQLF